MCPDELPIPELTVEPPQPVPPRRTPMDKSTKLILMIFGGLITTGLLAFGLIIGYNSYKETKAAQAHELMEANLENLMKLNNCAKFSDSEQSRLEAARNAGPERQKVVLVQIHEERREFWLQQIKASSESIDDVNNRVTKAINLGVYGYVSNTLDGQRDEAQKNLKKALTEAAGFAAAVEKIKQWKPMTWEMYKKSSNSTKPKDNEQKGAQA